MIENKNNEQAKPVEKQENTKPRATENTNSRPNRNSDDNSDRPKRNFRPTPRRDKRKFFMKRKVCYFCKNKDVAIDYKNVGLMKRFIAESGKITPRRFSGTCARHQRKLSTEIKRARQMALIPYTD